MVPAISAGQHAMDRRRLVSPAAPRLLASALDGLVTFVNRSLEEVLCHRLLTGQVSRWTTWQRFGGRSSLGGTRAYGETGMACWECARTTSCFCLRTSRRWKSA